MPATTKVIERKPRTFRDQSYLWEMFRGIGVTSRQFFRNLFTGKDIVTVQYPEEQREYPKRYRGLHRLTYRDNGDVRCVACMCCSTACPADCIHIVAGEHEDPSIERFPIKFVIDELRCIACGFCVEACPCDAIRMDTGKHCETFVDRQAAFFPKNVLLDDLGRTADGAPVLSHAVQGGRIKKTSGKPH